MEKTNIKKKISIVVENLQGPLRIDKYLSSLDFIPSRSQATNAISSSLVFVNGSLAKTSTTVKNGDSVEVLPPPEQKRQPLDFELNIVFEDKDVIVVNKPAGLLVHPTASNNQMTLVDALKKHTPHLSRGYSPDRPGIVHRLDRDTSGLLIVAKTDSAQDNLHSQFKNKTVRRIYWAVTFGKLSSDVGTISSFLERNPTQRTKRLSIRDPKTKQIIRPGIGAPAEGRIAITHYKNLQTGIEGLSLLELQLETGRTHQIRVHLQESGTPIVGDSLYTSKSFCERLRNKTLRDFVAAFTRCALHAKEISFLHPSTGKTISAVAPLPEDFKYLMRLAGLTCLE